MSQLGKKGRLDFNFVYVKDKIKALTMFFTLKCAKLFCIN